MADSRDLLIEIGTEELPPKALKRLSAAFTREVTAGLANAKLGHGDVKPYATPRRLAVWIRDLETAQPDQNLERRGPALAAAFDDEGNATKACQGFARSCGVAVEDLQKLETEKGAWLVFRSEQKGESTTQLIPAIVNQALAKLPIPKRMRWGDLDTEFVRPVHWVVMLFGDEVVEGEVLGIRADRYTRGHRFHHPEQLYLAEPAAYGPLLETEGHVVADLSIRREAIAAQVAKAGAALNGTPDIDEALLDEVTALVEWPVPVTGRFDKRFLEIPAEALVSAMKGHQKYFPIYDDSGKLLPHFITISNIESRDPSMVSSGNERVIRPRLEDAAFFWSRDCKTRLEDRIESLKSVIFQKKLGSLYEKSERISHLAAHIADQLGLDQSMAERAGMLCKTDLMCDMVGEFPELQGTMGRYYASHDGEPEAVATAMEEQYQPRFAGDQIPQGGISQCIALADKLDSLVGIFGIGQLPTGDKDPYGLRRATLGILRIIIEGDLDLDLLDLIRQAAKAYGATISNQEVVEQVFDYTMERLRGYYQDKGYSGDSFDAVLSQRPQAPTDFDQRIQAVESFRKLPEAESLAAANKRIANILKKSAITLADTQVDTALLQESGEKALAEQLGTIQSKVAPLLTQRDYTATLTELAQLRGVVDAFFDQVMVMAEDEALRDNRLKLLTNLRAQFLAVADVSRLQG